MTGHEDRASQLGTEPGFRVQGVTAGQTSQSGSASVPTRHPKAGLRAVIIDHQLIAIGCCLTSAPQTLKARDFALCYLYGFSA